MSRRRLAALVAPIAAIALVLSSCGGGQSGGLKGDTEFKAGAQDINAQSADKLQDGGELKWPVDQLPDNWNRNQLDGNVQDGVFMVDAMFPYMFKPTRNNTAVINHDYLDNWKVTSKNPQVITYTINPKAKWNDGKPITWEDFDAQFKALSGQSSKYLVSSNVGYDDIQKVEKGANDRQVKVTFTKNFSEWKSLFSPLYPKAVNSSPNAFNKGLVEKPGASAGPFKLGTIDRTAKLVTLVRDPNWWGTKPHLDKITFRVIARDALADSFNSGAIDFYQIGSNVDLFRQAQQSQGGKIREAAQSQYNLTDFNGAKSSILHDQNLRIAIQKGIDTTKIAKGVLQSIQPNPKPLGNHFFVRGDPHYKDNSGVVKYDVAASKKMLDDLGWKMNGQYRGKDGKQLKLRVVETANNPISQTIDKITQDQLKKIGVKGVIEPVPEDKFFQDYVNTGNYDLIGYGFTGTPFPVSSNASIFTLTKQVQQNYSRIGNDKLNQLFAKANAELDETKRFALTQEIDKEIWKTAHILPDYQVPGAFLARNSLANFGAFGFAQNPRNYTDIGFMKK